MFIFEKKRTMFVFGLFSTHLPYIILFVLYAMYFVLSLNGRKNDIPVTQFTDEVKSLSVEETENFHESAVNTYNFQDYFINSDTTQLPDKPDFSPGNNLFLKIDDIHCCPLLTCQLYSNPPPSC